MMPEEEIILGRHPSSQIVISNPRVSSKHCRLTKISEHVYLVEDMESTNGTFKNGLRIRRSLVTQNDELVLADHPFDVNELMTPKPEVKKEETIEEQFRALKLVYSTYMETKLKIQKGDTMKKTVIRSALALIPIVGASIGILATTTLNNQEKLLALEEEFKINYICPSCQNFLGNLPWEHLQNKGSCRFCKTEWVEKVPKTT